ERKTAAHPDQRAGLACLALDFVGSLRACLKTTRGAVFVEKAVWRGATKENIPCGSSTEEQRSQTAFCAKTLRAAGLLSLAGVGSVVTARCGDASPSPPWPKPKSLAATLLTIFREALNLVFAGQRRWGLLRVPNSFWCVVLATMVAGASGF